jgi:hypothetical protein
VTDKNGTPVTAGARVLFLSTLRDEWREGTVRAVKEHTYYMPTETRWEALVDDGDPACDDLRANGFHVAAWVDGAGIEVLP